MNKSRAKQATGRKRSRTRMLAGLGASLGAIILVGAALTFVFGHSMLNGYGKDKLETAFAEAHPGNTLRIGELSYSMAANRLIAHSATLSGTSSTFKADWISLTGVRWGRLLFGMAGLPEILAQASLDATNLNVEFPQAQYGIRCERLRASVRDSELIGEKIELRSLARDEAFFGADVFRTTLYHVVVPECKVSGLAYRELLDGTSYRARSVHFSRPSFEALVNLDKPSPPFLKSPPMIHEALAAIRHPLRVDRLSITNGQVSYCERMAVGADPGVMTFSAINISAEGIANRGGASAAIELQGQC
ncbi:MAG: hypothetical protein H7X97_02915, partial [Opitutaceae bacterium]|nr:hypothetical protein [Verrucomicrobiales bacterium]